MLHPASDLADFLLYAVFVASAVAVPLYALHVMNRQLRGTFGRPYALVVEEMFEEGERRAALLARIAEMREARIARLERRLETGR